MRLGKSQREKNEELLVKIAIFRDGKVLFGKRNDDKRWDIPGGHLKHNEEPQKGIVREVYEETGLKITKLKFLGSCEIQDKNRVVYAYKGEADGEPTVKLDPDEECSKWEWLDKTPEDLHSRENVVLQFIGWQDKTLDLEPHTKLHKSEEIEVLMKASSEKGWKPAFWNKLTNETVVSPGWHNIDVLPNGDFTDDWVDGFVNPEGLFHDREQTRQKIGVADSFQLKDRDPTPFNDKPVIEKNYSDTLEDMLGYDNNKEKILQAARFLSGEDIKWEDVRNSPDFDIDKIEESVLSHIKLPQDAKGKQMLNNIMKLQSLDKAEEERKVVKGVVPGSEEVAKEIQEALDSSTVRSVKLGGKHSKGALVTEGEIKWLLKPGYGDVGPAYGVNEEVVGQSRREAAFYDESKNFGLEMYLCRTELISINGLEWAAIKFLPSTFKNVQKRSLVNPNIAKEIFDPFIETGVVHKLAAMDYVLGNPDRHAQNIMADDNGKKIYLIDHGSTFAGISFSPAHDKNSFIPYYLRFSGPSKFNMLSAADKMDFMPQVSDNIRKHLISWLSNISAHSIENTMVKYSINPEPSLQRLNKLLEAASRYPIDLSINMLWAGAI